jgi:hypothetical protein
MNFYKKIVFFFLIFGVFQGYAQNTLDVLGLDNTSPAAGAYSLRKLSSSYLGSAIQVRRSTDNSTQNIGFDSNGNLDSNSLTSFVGSGDGFVSIWFDQSGKGNNAVQNTLLNQPKIITAGVIERANGSPTITFSGSHLVVSSTAFNNDLTGFLVYKASGSNASSGNSNTWYIMNGIFGAEQGGAVPDFAYGIYNNKFTAGNGPVDNSIRGNVAVNDNVIRQHSWTRNSTTGQINLYSNGASDGTANLNTGTSSSVTSVAIGANHTYNGQVFYNGSLSEMLLFSAVLDNSRQTIENNQGLCYSMYLLATHPSSNNQSLPVGGTPTSLSVLSSDPAATYQWYSNTVSANTGGIILSGETNKNYTPSTTVEGTLYYYAVISTAVTTFPSNVSGYVRVGIEITSQPSTTNQAVIQNSSVNSLNVTATGSNITYQWYKNVNRSNTGGTLISGATTNSYTPLNTDLGISYYYVVVSGNNTILVSAPSGTIKIIPTPIIWSGPTITFQKADYSDFTIVDNQDVISSTVKITRGDAQGLFNIATESGFGGSSPSNTEWAEGTLLNYADLTYENWQQAVGYGNAGNSVNKTYVVHLIKENIFLELKVLSWTSGGNGGGFSYSRTTACEAPSEPTVSNQSFNSPATVADLAATGTNIKWYLESSGGSSLQTSTTLTSVIYYVTQTVNNCESARKPISVTIISRSAPTISNFNNSIKTYFDTNYTIVPPTSNSSGAFTYTSSDINVATINDSTVTLVGPGTTTITAAQAADSTYSSASITADLTVNTVSVVTKYGEVAATNLNYVDHYGAIKRDSGLSSNGEIIMTKTAFNALNFSSSLENYASLPPATYFSGDFTIECWVYPTDHTNWSRVIDFGNGTSDNVLFATSVSTSGKPGLHISGSELEANEQISLNQWSHLAVTLSGTTATIYINGIASGTANFPIPANVIRNDNYIGRSNWGWGDPAPDASLDDLRIWNVAKTPSQIQAAMNNELLGNETGLIAYFKFNEGVSCAVNTAITTLANSASSGSIYNSTLHGFTLNGSCTSNFVKGKIAY